ncbi:MAG: SH3 domain-containing protein [Anaerolineae bacterium]|nr:SH3 domain-containing protein [Anaerolineae bacterium]
MLFKRCLYFQLIAVVVAVFAAAPVHAQDDATATELPDGTVVTQQPDGAVVIDLSNGLTVTLSADNQVIISGARVPLEASRSSLQQTEMSDGTIITPGEDGSVQFNLPDGTLITVSPENEVKIEESAGPVEASDSDILCTFTAVRYINLRAGPSTNYEIAGVLAAYESIDVTGQETGADGYVWWEVGDAWVRSDLGESDCPAVCGNRVCESGESNSNCPQDCPAPTSTPAPTEAPAASASAATDTSASNSCLVSDCESCYRSISCYPECNQCSCSQNAYGCPTCYCTTPASAETAANPCDYASCEACIAAFPCGGQPCGTTSCTLNEYGCPTCVTSP